MIRRRGAWCWRIWCGTLRVSTKSRSIWGRSRPLRGCVMRWMRNWMEKRKRLRTAGCSDAGCLEAPLLSHGNIEVRVADPAWADDEPGDVRPVYALGSIRPSGEVLRLKADQRIAG